MRIKRFYIVFVSNNNNNYYIIFNAKNMIEKRQFNRTDEIN